MNRYAIVKHLGTAKQFAILVDDTDGVRTLGVSPQGKEWERWADARPPQERRTIEQLLATLGSHLQIEGPSRLTRAVQTEIDALLKEDTTEVLDSTTASARDTE